MSGPRDSFSARIIPELAERLLAECEREFERRPSGQNLLNVLATVLHAAAGLVAVARTRLPPSVRIPGPGDIAGLAQTVADQVFDELFPPRA